MKTIAVDIDDTLNNYSEVLRVTDFRHDSTYPFSAEQFTLFLEMARAENATRDDLLSPEFGYFRQRINSQCYENATARAGAIDFMQWLRHDGWEIVICTHRDLRRTEEATRSWLAQNQIPFDYLFIAVDKLAFCKSWEIHHLVDDHLFSVKFADDYGINVYYPIMPKHTAPAATLARGFTSFEEVRKWIQSSN